MSICLVTGATGMVGARLVERLLQQRVAVRALVRDERRARAVLGPAVELVAGDITDPGSLARAVCGVKQLFHVAGITEQWQRDPAIFERVNCIGTRNVLIAARAAAVERVVYTSTMDVFDAPRGARLTEACSTTVPRPTAYERSKQAAEREVDAAVRDGLDVVMVHPAAIYGPCAAPATASALIVRLLRGRVPMLPPGGMSLVYVDGVVAGILAAAQRGASGERYLLADGHLGTRELAEKVLSYQGRGRAVPPTAPAWLVRGVARMGERYARWSGRPPLVSTGELSFLRWDVRVDAAKAEQRLGFERTSIELGLQQTVRYFEGSDRC